MRLIDADKLMAEFADVMGYAAPSIQKGFSLAAQFVEAAPTIDAENPRPKGKWMHHEVKGFFIPQCWCSECNLEMAHEMPYCPNCGAKMEV